MVDINSVVVGITTRCNARCKFCARTHGWLPNNEQTDLNLDLILVPLLSRINQILFVGSFGDAIFHPNLLQFLEFCRNKYPDISFNIHTNGSKKDNQFWEKLGRLIGTKNRVLFCIDGLKDTHHIHRHVDFDLVINNLKIYISNGGVADWQFIVFDYNQHQIDEASNLAKSIGCKEFMAIRSIYYDSEFRPPDGVISRNDLMRKIKKPTVYCSWFENKEIYINEYGEVHPCCHLSPYYKNNNYKEIKDIYHNNKDLISLYNYDIDTIMNNQYIQYVYKNKNSIRRCKNTCGFSEKLRPYVHKIKHCVF